MWLFIYLFILMEHMTVSMSTMYNYLAGINTDEKKICFKNVSVDWVP